MYKYILTLGVFIVLGVLVVRMFPESTSDFSQVPRYKENVAREVPDGWREYKNEQYLFSVLYEDGMTVTENQKDDALTVTFEDIDMAEGFQIFVIPYSASTISDERFLKDVPLGVREGEEKTYVGGIEAVQFWSKDMALGDTREVWFIKKPYLYEVTTLAPLAMWLESILATWQFL